MIQSNYVRLIGRLGGDPEMRFLPSGTPVTNLNLAVSKRWLDKDSGEWKESTVWVRCSAFAALAESLVNKLAKGDQVMIEGELKAPQAWVDRNNPGQAKASVEVGINQWMLIPKAEKQEKKDPWEEDTDES